MGRKHRHSSSKTRSDDAFDVSTDSEVLRTFIKKNSALPSPIIHPSPPKPLKLFEDRRTFHPDGKNRPLTAVNARPRTVIRAERSSEAISRPHAAPKLSPRLSVEPASKIAVCIRRKTRREVIFALNKTGKGARSKRTRNQWSNTSCGKQS